MERSRKPSDSSSDAWFSSLISLTNFCRERSKDCCGDRNGESCFRCTFDGNHAPTWTANKKKVSHCNPCFVISLRRTRLKWGFVCNSIVRYNIECSMSFCHLGQVLQSFGRDWRSTTSWGIHSALQYCILKRHNECTGRRLCNDHSVVLCSVVYNVFVLPIKTISFDLSIV